jgi:hypothetical protein
MYMYMYVYMCMYIYIYRCIYACMQTRVVESEYDHRLCPKVTPAKKTRKPKIDTYADAVAKR